MKKVYNFRVDKTNLILENSVNSNEKFVIEIDKLQFDTKSFYEALFADANEHIEIEVTKDKTAVDIEDPKIQKITSHVFDTIVLIVDQVCSKLNEDCFCKTDTN